MPPLHRIHHVAIHVADLDASLRFWRDGVGMAPLLDHEFEGDWPALLGVPGRHVRSVMLGDPDHPEAGVVELVRYREGTGEAPAHDPAAAGFLLVSLFTEELDAMVERLEGMGHGPAARIEVPGPDGPVPMASLRDPDGVLVELIGVAGLTL